ncbi:MAG: dienelactone hydrolase family protein [Burkholderiales bacterium]
MSIESEVRSLTGARAFDRRGFVVTSLGAGFALSVLPVAAQTMITTPADGLNAGEVKVPAAGGEMPAYVAMPSTGGGFPVILVVSEIWGAHEHIRDVARRFARLGYFAIAPELFARQGDAKAMTDIQALIRDIVAKTPDAQVMADLDACVAYAKASGRADAARVGVTGFCWGGRTTLMYAAHNPSVKAAVAWYGPTVRSYFPGDKTPLDHAAATKPAVLGLYGGADQGIPNDTVERYFAALKSAGNAGSQFVIYPDTPHAFHADYRPTYRKEAADDGWKRATAWFKQYL